MLQLDSPVSLHPRLLCWGFKGEWPIELKIADTFYAGIMKAYKELKENKSWLKILGMVLGIGNILNGGTPKGQADGFDLGVLGKVNLVKDVNGQSMLTFICKKLKEEDENFSDDCRNMLKIIGIKDTDISYIKTKTDELTAMVVKAKDNFARVLSANEPPDNYKD